MAETRRTVTVVFADVSDSTALGEHLDPEALRRVMERYFAEARTAFERHGGTVEKFIGDAVMAVFGIPVAHEDDALRAVRAATEMRMRLAELNEELARERGVTLTVRTGINTGEVVAGDPGEGQFYASGDAVNVAARLEQAAQPGEVLLGDKTRTLVGDAVLVEAVEPIPLKGKSQPVPVYRLLEVIEGAPALARRFDTPFVGRDEELSRALASFDRSVAERIPLLLTVLGPAGIGKTRLAGELIAQVGEAATVLQGRCLSYGEGITYWPLQEMLRGLAERPAGAPDPEQARSTEETFWAYRKLFEALAKEKPLLFLLEDIHWAEPTLLDLIEHIVEWTPDVSMLILCLARPEFAEERPGWPGDRVELRPLQYEEAVALVGSLGTGVDVNVQARAVTVAEGNPLFLEQMLALTTDEDSGDISVPQTIQALLSARLDRLENHERSLLEAAAVVGKEFWRRAVVHLSPPETEVSALLQRLVRRRLIDTERSSLPGEDAFRFGHILIREAAYAGIPKGKRAELHERFADWLQEVESPYEEIVGYHLEKAFRYREELGRIDERGQILGRQAAEVLSASGLKARERQDNSAAANLLGRAVDLLPDHDEHRLSLLPELGDALFWAGRYAEAQSVLGAAIESARRVGNRGVEWEAVLARLRVDAQVDPVLKFTTSRELEEKAREALAVFEELSDARGQAKAGIFVGEALMWRFRYLEAARAFRHAEAQARLVGDESLIAICESNVVSALAEGPTPIDEAVTRLEEMLATAPDRVPFFERWVLIDLAHLYAKQGRIDAARANIARARRLAEEVGNSVELATLAAFHAASIERHAGNLELAEADLRWGYEVLEDLGEQSWRSTVAARLADVLVAQGCMEEGDRFLRISEETAASDDLASQVPLRWIRARIEMQRGNTDEAERFAREAVSLLEETDDWDTQAKALIDLAAVLPSNGKTEEAIQRAEHALRLATRRGNKLLERDARHLLHDLQEQRENIPSKR
jgi:class 3 adenylate cyclase/tetratricopeptide (TPR) repeat protein